MSEKERLDPKLVEEFVGVAHGDLSRVEAILKESPGVVNASWDWGGGDWETAPGAAAHMGRRDIAELLITYGARIDVFAAAMLGRLEIVRSIISSYPAMENALGPHGIPLINHAKAGGSPALPVLEYLESL
jgi:hypothetical protein